MSILLIGLCITFASLAWILAGCIVAERIKGQAPYAILLAVLFWPLVAAVTRANGDVR